uniref:Uncharacterized protein n=1 Tax=viral metagenome TaxID=1070528 RepID=A0A6M3L413_9ZZZZ
MTDKHYPYPGKTGGDEPQEELLLTDEEITNLAGMQKITVWAGDPLEPACKNNRRIIAKAQVQKCQQHYRKEMEEVWKLQDLLMDMTVLNQNAPKITLTNDEVGWFATYLPDPPYRTGEITVIGGDPLDAVRKLNTQVSGKE